ncbi:MAG: hypothetical protein ACXV5I_08225 [Halobacteriota archaeon]
MSSKHEAVRCVLHEAEREQRAAQRRLQRERGRAERALQSIIDLKACDLSPVHEAEASVQWWGRVVATVTKILDEQQKRDHSRHETAKP